MRYAGCSRKVQPATSWGGGDGGRGGDQLGGTSWGGGAHSDSIGGGQLR